MQIPNNKLPFLFFHFPSQLSISTYNNLIIQTITMRSSTFAPLAALVAQAIAQDATPVTGNPIGVLYKATLPEKPFFAGADIEGNVKGFISGVATPDGNAVEFTVQFENLPKEGGPFSYHLHAAAAVDGNCTSTKAHLDPFGRGQEPPCDASAINTCEVGDLSGKHGKITSDPFTASFTDIYASTREDSESFFGSRSFVVHYANGTRLTCANFEQKPAPPPAMPSIPSNCTTYTTIATIPVTVPVSPPSGTGVATTSVPGVPGVTPTPIPTPPISAAAAVHFSLPLLVAGFAAAMFAL
ncbi:Cell surface Cu-only superoxide dismutase [Paramyrothecium foliicola]|nr:Cell surface Cu-only superoxide dismutase [Paramyrothecium foliicola]